MWTRGCSSETAAVSLAEMKGSVVRTLADSNVTKDAADSLDYRKLQAALLYCSPPAEEQQGSSTYQQYLVPTPTEKNMHWQGMHGQHQPHT